LCNDGNDTIYGGAGNDQLYDNGLPGWCLDTTCPVDSDTMVGGSGSDTVVAAFGDDTLNVMDGVSGNDTADGGEGTDACTYDPGDIILHCP
jgi:Ca2+-binding RTX toxin-like protein